MTKTFKYIIFRSFMNVYYTEKKDELIGIKMKASLKNEVKAYAAYMRSLIWLRFYTGIIDIVLNTLILLCISIFIYLVTIFLYYLLYFMNHFHL